ncbi:sensor histidine kinase [Aurantimonas sp. VKM B-3413]|uniref:sensor histidine kinase n=1 Tax=Aurantimonas sp. VKM B-3413 TaxID=2779401 RepID=UPI001E528EC4|nr:cache domain-containing protein [Aurantimonas sp. VKM B-3413]MCB8837406.1 hypothetical protein [Aurantimonas sp. VKM B-3413]
MWSFRTVLTSTLVGLQVVALLAILALTYFASQNALLSYAAQLTERVAQDTTSYTENFLNPADDAAALSQRLAENAVLTTADRATLERYFFEILRGRADFAGVYYGAADGSFVYVSRNSDVPGASYRSKRIETSPVRHVTLDWYDETFHRLSERVDDADSYDPRTRPWYEGAKASRDVVWTDPYIFFTSQRPGITVATPVRADPRLPIRGAVGIDIEIDALSRFLTRLDVSANGSAAIVSQNGDVIAHRNAAFVLTPDDKGGQRFAKVGEVPDPALAEAVASLPGGLSSLEPGETRLTRFTADGESWRGAVRRLSASRTPWVVVTYLPESDILAPIYRIRHIGLIVVGIVAALTAGLAVLLGRAMTRPLVALSAQADRISEGDFEDVPQTGTRMKEFAATQRAMRRATSWLRERHRENQELTEQLREAGRVLERRVDERTAELAVVNRDLADAHRNASMLAGELDHRVKNVFAIVAGLVSLAARHAASPQEVAEEARKRINALARAHSGTQNDAGAAGLDTIVHRVLEPFEDAEELDLAIGGEPITVARENVTPLGLILYELATNAAKYGSLRRAGGRISVTWSTTAQDEIRLIWSERPNEAPAEAKDPDIQSNGFGSVMLDAMAKRLGATIEREIGAEGLTVRLTMPRIDADTAASDASGAQAMPDRRATAAGYS